MTTVSDAPAREPGDAADGRPQPNRWVIAAVAAVLVAGLVLYAWTRSDLWLDEALSVNIARLPFGQLRDALRHDGAPPLYYALLHVWTAVFGTGNVAVRIPSALAMIGAAVAIWFLAARLAGRRAAWIAVVLMATSPYAIRYATETRMYALEILLVSLGMLAFQRALESPTVGRLVAFGAVVVALAYTQYWTLYLLLVVGGALVLMAWRGPHRTAARRMLIAMAVAGLAFLPWLPTFLYQRAHTGTPWGTPVLPGIPIGETFRDFSGGDEQEGWLLLFPMLAFLLVGVFGRARDDRHIDLDLRAQPEARWPALFGAVTLVVALSLNYIAGGAFQTRYSALVFPFFIVLAARGASELRDPRILGGVMAVVVALGLTGGVRNMVTQRTQAGEVAAVLRSDAQPGDLVVYCPDQLGPAVSRLTQEGLDQVTFPAFDRPQRVDWVDYKERIAATNVNDFAARALERAGDHTVWLVSAPGYTTHKGTCEGLSEAFAGQRGRLVRTLSDEEIFEEPALQEFPAKSGG